MVPLKRLFSSTLGRKYLMGASGFALVLFLFAHLIGNLTLYTGSGDAINAYAAKLHGTLGPAIYLVEIALASVILLHVVLAIQISFSNKAARGVSYENLKSKGGPTKNTVASRNMIVSGVVLLTFIVIHLAQMRFGEGIEDGYTTTVDGVMTLDVYRKVTDVFTNPFWVLFYVSCMLFLGAHYRHGFWSMFQSLGALNPRWSKVIYTMGWILALIISAGFLFIPIFVYFNERGGL